MKEQWDELNLSYLFELQRDYGEEEQFYGPLINKKQGWKYIIFSE